MEIPSKTRIKITIWPKNPTTCYVPWENHNWKRYIYPHVHCSTICDSLEYGMGWEVGGGFKGESTYVHLWLIHADVRQRPTQYCKAITLQLKVNQKMLATHTKKVYSIKSKKKINKLDFLNIKNFSSLKDPTKRMGGKKPYKKGKKSEHFIWQRNHI